MPKVAILRNEVRDSADASESDVLTQTSEVRAALECLGHEVVIIACSLDLEAARTALQCQSVDCVFNLVESLGGTDRLMSAATLMLDSLDMPYTGASTLAILRSGDKLRAKLEMMAAGIPTPAWLDIQSGVWLAAGQKHADGELPCQQVIVKAIHEHASLGMTNDAVMDWNCVPALQQALLARKTETGHAHLAEEFIAGREFNLSVLELDGQPHVLAPAEIDFSGLPTDLPRIVGANAKWEENSIEYQQTPRKFDFCEADTPLVQQLHEIAARCWELFELRGYARVDFRVDRMGRPFVLEVNANPCLSCDAGFIAAAAQSQFKYNQIIDSILIAANRNQTHVLHSSHS